MLTYRDIFPSHHHGAWTAVLATARACTKFLPLWGETLLSSCSKDHPGPSWCLHDVAGTQRYSFGDSTFNTCSCYYLSSVTVLQRKGVPPDTSAGWGTLAGLPEAAGSLVTPPPPRMMHFSECPTGASPVSNCKSATVWYWYIWQALDYLVFKNYLFIY